MYVLTIKAVAKTRNGALNLGVELANQIVAAQGNGRSSIQHSMGKGAAKLEVDVSALSLVSLDSLVEK